MPAAGSRTGEIIFRPQWRRPQPRAGHGGDEARSANGNTPVVDAVSGQFAKAYLEE
jgi:hypothetical protein